MQLKPSQRLVAQFKIDEDAIDIERLASDTENYALTLYEDMGSLDDFVYDVFEATVQVIPLECRTASVEDALWDLCQEICENVQSDLSQGE